MSHSSAWRGRMRNWAPSTLLESATVPLVEPTWRLPSRCPSVAHLVQHRLITIWSDLPPRKIEGVLAYNVHGLGSNRGTANPVPTIPYSKRSNSSLLKTSGGDFAGTRDARLLSLRLRAFRDTLRSRSYGGDSGTLSPLGQYRISRSV